MAEVLAAVPNFHDGVGITPDHERHFADVPSHRG
jgi:hypothetical protein